VPAASVPSRRRVADRGQESLGLVDRDFALGQQIQDTAFFFVSWNSSLFFDGLLEIDEDFVLDVLCFDMQARQVPEDGGHHR